MISLRKSINARIDKIKLKINCITASKRYWMWDGVPNFGDMLNKVILEKYIKGSKFVNLKDANIIAIGSILQKIIEGEYSENNNTLHVLGSGFIYDKKTTVEKFNRNVKIHALRGYLSKKRCEAILDNNLDNIVLGDFGLLANTLIDSTKIKKIYDVGIIPHYQDADSKYLDNIKLQKYSSVLIDVKGDPLKTLKLIAQCKVIIATAMHGLIIADSLNIPNCRLVISELFGGDYKFNDYYSVFNITEHKKIDLTTTLITDDTIDDITKEYKITKEDVAVITKKILSLLSNINKSSLNALKK